MIYKHPFYKYIYTLVNLKLFNYLYTLYFIGLRTIITIKFICKLSSILILQIMTLVEDGVNRDSRLYKLKVYTRDIQISGTKNLNES